MSANGGPGSTVTIPVEMAALGNENTVGLSLVFDPAVLTYQSSVKGTDATTLLKNENQASQGRVGLAATVDQGQSFPAGTRQLAVVTFTVAANPNAASATVSPGDQPIARQVVAANAASLTAGTQFNGGSVSILSGYEADVTPRPTGKNNGTVNLQDFVLIGRFAIGLDTPAAGGEFQRADCAPRESKGDNVVNLADYVQSGRFATGLDTAVSAGGPSGVSSSLSSATGTSDRTSSTRGSITSQVNTEIHVDNGYERVAEVSIAAQGKENSLGWSVNFDPLQWKFEDASSPLASAGILLNKSRLAEGRLGIAVVLPPGGTLEPALQHLVNLSFVPAQANSRPLVLGIGDIPVARQGVGVDASTVATTFNLTASENLKPLAVVSAADLGRAECAAGGLAAAFGSNLAEETVSASGTDLPTELGATRVRIRDSKEAEHFASLLFVSPNQINYVIPDGVATGMATVEVLHDGGVVARGLVPIDEVAPALFTVTSTGDGYAAAYVIVASSDGNRQFSPVASYNADTGGWTPIPIHVDSQDASGSDNQVYLALFGTGIKGMTTSTKAMIGDIEVPVTYSGQHSTFAGTDQVNLRLPSSLTGKGMVDLEIEVDGVHSNHVRILLQ